MTTLIRDNARNMLRADSILVVNALRFVSSKILITTALADTTLAIFLIFLSDTGSDDLLLFQDQYKIGRASCRERV